MIEKEFIPYEEALALKEIGFDEPCLAAYYVFGDGRLIDGSYGQTEPELFINGIGKELEDRMEELKMFAYCATLVPTFSQAFRWLREKYDIHHQIVPFYSDKEGPAVNYYFAHAHQLPPLKVKTYEEAELACLRKLIDCRIVKKKNK